MRFATTLVIALCAANIVYGWSAGYHAAFAYLTFWSLTALVVLTAHRLVTRIWPSRDVLDTCVRTAVVVCAIIVGGGLVLGALHRLTVGAFVTLESALLVMTYAITRQRSGDPIDMRDEAASDAEPRAAEGRVVHAWMTGLACALLAFALGFAATHAPMTLYDSLSYHLFFSARWLQDHALSILPTPFSDEAQAYAPANGELWLLWLMLPFHGDLLARFGQMPFAIFAAATLYLLARRLGAPRAGAFYPSVLLGFSRPVLEQAIGANVDLICASLFLASLYLAIVAVDRNRRADWVLLGVAIGLYAGTKYLALVYLPVLALLIVARGVRENMLWTLPGITAFGLPWYARNWIVAGSPLYPASLTLGPLTIARGAFGRGAMLNTVFHTADPRLIPAIVAHGIGPTLCLLWLPAAIGGGFFMVRRSWWPHAIVACAPLLVLALCWLAVPVNVDSRFLMAGVAPALLPFAFLFRAGHRRWNRAMHVLLTLGLVWIIVGRDVEIPARLPWFMAGWLSLGGLVPGPQLLPFFAIAAVAAAAWYWRPRDVRWSAPLAACLVLVPATVLALGTDRWWPAQSTYLSITSPYIRSDLIFGWRWMDEHVHASTVAYTGDNLPYPLAGSQLTNRVLYVNIDGRPRWKFHDYDRAYRRGKFTPTPPLLATRSGELLPVTRDDNGTDALRPRYERMQGIRDAWIDNLQRLDVSCLFVTQLSAYEIDYVWHDESGFPIENTWADGDPAMFDLIYHNSQVRIYRVLETGVRSGA